MEGVGGTRMGSRSSTRYGPATVFSGPVKKWKKKWVHISPPNPPPNSSSPSAHLLLYKWTPISHPNNNGNGNDNGNNKEDASSTAAATPALEEPPRRKFRYIPVSVVEEQMKEAAGKVEDEAKPVNTAPNVQSPREIKGEGSDGAAEATDKPMEESQALEERDEQTPQEVNETNLDLSLGLKARDEDMKMADQSEVGQVERAGDAEIKRNSTNSEADNRSKKSMDLLEMRV